MGEDGKVRKVYDKYNPDNVDPEEAGEGEFSKAQRRGK
jgi:hypothetical protein